MTGDHGIIRDIRVICGENGQEVLPAPTGSAPNVCSALPGISDDCSKLRIKKSEALSSKVGPDLICSRILDQTIAGPGRSARENIHLRLHDSMTENFHGQALSGATDWLQHSFAPSLPEAEETKRGVRQKS